MGWVMRFSVGKSSTSITLSLNWSWLTPEDGTQPMVLASMCNLKGLVKSMKDKIGVDVHRAFSTLKASWQSSVHLTFSYFWVALSLEICL